MERQAQRLTQHHAPDTGIPSPEGLHQARLKTQCTRTQHWRQQQMEHQAQLVTQQHAPDTGNPQSRRIPSDSTQDTPHEDGVNETFNDFLYSACTTVLRKKHL